MTRLSKSSIVYFDPVIHDALCLKAATNQVSISQLVDEAVRLLMGEDQEDLHAIAQCAKESAISYEALLNVLKQDGKI